MDNSWCTHTTVQHPPISIQDTEGCPEDRTDAKEAKDRRPHTAQLHDQEMLRSAKATDREMHVAAQGWGVKEEYR